MPNAGQPASLVAAAGFCYALAVTVTLLLLQDFFSDEPNSDAMLLWLLVPLIASLTTWMAVKSGKPLLRGWIWFGIVLTAFYCWISVFSYGLWFLPLNLFLVAAAVSPWNKPPAA